MQPISFRLVSEEPVSTPTPTPDWLTVTVTNSVVAGVNAYHTEFCIPRTQKGDRSDGSMVDLDRSTVSLKGSEAIGAALAKASLPARAAGSIWSRENVRSPPPSPPVPQHCATMK